MSSRTPSSWILATILALTLVARPPLAIARGPGGSSYASDSALVPAASIWDELQRRSSARTSGIVVRARHRDENGPLVREPLVSGDAVYFEAVVSSIGSDSVAESDADATLSWEILDSNDSPLEEFFKTVYVSGYVPERMSHFQTDLRGLESGAYTARLTHRRTSDSRIVAQGVLVFHIKPKREIAGAAEFGSSILRTFPIVWARTSDRGTTLLSQGALRVLGDKLEGEVKYAYLNVRGHLQVMTIHLEGTIDPASGLVTGVLSGSAVMTPVWGDPAEGRVSGSFKGSEVDGGFRGTWNAVSDVSFLFQNEHHGYWETR